MKPLAAAGDPNLLLDLPLADVASTPNGYTIPTGSFKALSWLSPHFPHLALVPRYNPFHGPLFRRLNVEARLLPSRPIALRRIRLTKRLGGQDDRIWVSISHD